MAVASLTACRTKRRRHSRKLLEAQAAQDNAQAAGSTPLLRQAMQRRLPARPLPIRPNPPPRRLPRKRAGCSAAVDEATDEAQAAYEEGKASAAQATADAASNVAAEAQQDATEAKAEAEEKRRTDRFNPKSSRHRRGRGGAPFAARILRQAHVRLRRSAPEHHLAHLDRRRDVGATSGCRPGFRPRADRMRLRTIRRCRIPCGTARRTSPRCPAANPSPRARP